jgi:hypothetical protein
MNLTNQVVPFTQAMIHTGKRLIFGTEQHKMLNGMILMLCQQPMEPSISEWMPSKAIISIIDLACYNPGINYASKVAEWRQVYHCQAVVIRKGFGLVSGLWAILVDLGIQLRQMGYGLTVTGISAMRALPKIKVRPTD